MSVLENYWLSCSVLPAYNCFCVDKRENRKTGILEKEREPCTGEEGEEEGRLASPKFNVD